jgi:hypothetical protein
MGTLSQLYAGIAGVTKSSIALVYDLDARVTKRPLVTQPRTTVWRTVINQYDFHPVDTLPEYALYTAFQRVFNAINRDDD